MGDRIAPVMVRPVRFPDLPGPAAEEQGVRALEHGGDEAPDLLMAVGRGPPPRSNPPRRSSSGPPGPWYTPSTVSIIVAVSFMVIAPSQVDPSMWTGLLYW